jgi:formylglycine-generating enzyme required for sulfatase activity
MKILGSLLFIFFVIGIFPNISTTKELPKIVVWDLDANNLPASFARTLTSILITEITKLKKYEAYTQENVRTLAGWTPERVKLGCTDHKCLIALGQLEIAKLISGSVGKIGNTYSISLNLFDTQSAKAENGASEVCRTEDELIRQFQQAIRKLFGFPPEPSVSEFRKAEQELTDRTFTNSIGMQFVRIEPGKFIMGSPKKESWRNSDEGAQHEVEITKPFYLGIYEVTQRQYREIMYENPSFFKMCGDDCPVEKVMWKDVQEFIARLNVKEKTDRYRLPTEAEWEYACRAGSQSAYYFGDDQNQLNDYAWYKDNTQMTHPIGQKKPNAWGLYDMHGNVNEWVHDWYGKYMDTSTTDPTGQLAGSHKVYRGGSWYNALWDSRCANRGKDKLDNWSQTVGFRLVRMP